MRELKASEMDWEEGDIDIASTVVAVVFGGREMEVRLCEEPVEQS